MIARWTFRPSAKPFRSSRNAHSERECEFINLEHVRDIVEKTTESPVAAAAVGKPRSLLIDACEYSV